MRKFIKYIKILAILLLGASCSEYLDVVPDNTVEVEHLFQTKAKAFSALATCYSFMPYNDNVNNTMQTAGDEFLPRLDPDYIDRNRGINLMKGGFQGTNDPILNFWDGRLAGTALYDGIRVCNTFLNSISEVPDITESERTDWIAQVKFLKGFYHFYLINKYGPIIIADENLTPSDDPESVKQYRQTVDVCFDYVLNLIEEAIADLDDRRTPSFDGQIDKTIAMSVKAKILMYAASPFFNGNSEFYSSFLNEDGVPYFNLEQDPEKWKLALDATEEAITQALTVGKSMYVYNEVPYAFDTAEDWEKSGVMKYAYSLRFAIVEPWNNELIWGLSNIDDRNTGNTFQTTTGIRLEGSLETNNAWQWMAASHRMTELFYTKNGVPINNDKTFNYDNRLSIGEIPDDDDYFRGYLQPLERTVNLYLNREPRFYAWLGTDRGIWRSQQVRQNLKMRDGESPGGKIHPTDYLWTGIGIKKFGHPETTSDQRWQTTTFYPRAIMRLSELYLMRAEARNEYSGPEQRVYDDLNIIRTRAGIPNIETVYSDANIVNNTGKHTDKVGLRDIIQTERLIELSFEGHRYDDIRRWKRASEFFKAPILGWNVEKSLTSEFYKLTTKQTREWITPRDYLFPIKLDELRLNSNLIQNPGWDR
ncbi:MAG: RagB/SusD family nutrient uptake outer membrane protein [Algibacter sp.]